MTKTPTFHRVHVALQASDLDASIAFYTHLLGAAPDKRRDGYARFAPPDIGIQLALNQATGDVQVATNGEHFGVVVPGSAEVASASARLAEAGLATRSEDGVVCCYARQDKVWATDPDGRAWEVYTVLDENTEKIDPASTCCQPVGDESSSELPAPRGCC